MCIYILVNAWCLFLPPVLHFFIYSLISSFLHSFLSIFLPSFLSFSRDIRADKRTGKEDGIFNISGSISWWPLSLCLNIFPFFQFLYVLFVIFVLSSSPRYVSQESEGQRTGRTKMNKVPSEGQRTRRTKMNKVPSGSSSAPASNQRSDSLVVRRVGMALIT